MPEPETFSEFLAVLIANPDYTIKQLAIASDISVETVKKYFRLIRDHLDDREYFPITDEEYTMLVNVLEKRKKERIEALEKTKQVKEEKVITPKRVISYDEPEAEYSEEEDMLPNDAKTFKDILRMTTTLGEPTINKMTNFYTKYRDLIHRDPMLLFNMLNGKLGHHRATLIMNSLKKVLDLETAEYYDPTVEVIDPYTARNLYAPPPKKSSDEEWFKQLIEKVVVAKALAGNNQSIDELLKLSQLFGKKEETVPISIKAEDKETTLNVPASLAPLYIMQQPKQGNDLVEAIKVVTSMFQPVYQLLSNNKGDDKEVYKQLIELYKAEKQDPLQLVKNIRESFPEAFQPAPESLEVAKFKVEAEERLTNMQMELQKWLAEREDNREERRMQIAQMNKYADVASQLLSQALPPLAQAMAQGVQSVQAQTQPQPQPTTNTAEVPDFDAMSDEELMRYNAQVHSTGEKLNEAWERYKTISNQLNTVMAKRQGKAIPQEPVTEEPMEPVALEEPSNTEEINTEEITAPAEYEL